MVQSAQINDHRLGRGAHFVAQNVEPAPLNVEVEIVGQVVHHHLLHWQIDKRDGVMDCGVRLVAQLVEEPH